MYYRGIVLVVCCIVQYGSIPVVLAAPESSLWLSYTEDEDNTKDTFVDFYWGVTEDDTLSLSAGQSQSEYLILNRDIEVESDFYHIGYQTLRTAPSSLRLYYEFWGKNNEFEMHTTALNYDYHADTVSLGLTYKYREINLYITTLASETRKIDISSNGYGPELFVYSGKLTWFLSGMWYDYSDNADQLFAFAMNHPYLALTTFGLKNYDRAGTINDWEATTGIEYQFDDLAVGLHYMKSRSAIDEEISQTYAMTLRAAFSTSWVFELGAGQVDGDTSDPVAYGSLGVGYRF